MKYIYLWYFEGFHKFLTTNSISDLPKSGKPPKCTQPFLTATEVATTCDMLQNVSVCTIRRLFGRMASRKPFLSVQHKRNRKKWCQAYLAMTPEKWKNFIFSDECCFQTHANIRRLPRRPKNSRYSKNIVWKR